MGKRNYTSRNIYLADKVKTARKYVRSAEALLNREKKSGNAQKIKNARSDLNSRKKELQKSLSRRDKFNKTFKRGMALPVSPFGTPSYYNTRKTMGSRVRKAYRGMEAQSRDAYRAMKEMTLRKNTTNERRQQIQDSIAQYEKESKRNALEAFRDWKSRKIPLKNLRIRR
jgi:hypothetical protein